MQDINAPLFSTMPGESILGAATRIIQEGGENYQICATIPKADIHLHLGGNASLEFLHDQALKRVGPGALDPENWGGRLDWSDSSLYLDYRDFSLRTLDAVIRGAKVDSREMTADKFIPPSQVIARGQEITRQLSEILSPTEEAQLREEQRINFERFKKLATYTPLGRKASLGEFLNVYRIPSDLVEATPSTEVLSAAIEDTMRRLSQQRIRYAEVKIGLPKISLARKIFPGLPDEESILFLSEKMFSCATYTIRMVNQKLIEEGKEPVDLRIVCTLSKSASRSRENLDQVKALLYLLQWRPKLCRRIVGIDGSSKEPDELPSLYKEHLDLIDKHNRSVIASQRIGITWHQGEDFSDTSLFGSIRRVHEIIDMGIQRLGHGLVLGMDPKLFLGQEFRMTRDDYKNHLVYERESRFEHPFPQMVTEESADLVRGRYPQEGSQRGRYPQTGSPEAEAFILAIRERQKHVLEVIKKKDIVIEINPTSNLYMALPSGRMEDHPLPFFLSEGVRLTINTDDAGIFNTNMARELVIAALLGRLTGGQLVEIINCGFQAAFSSCVRRETVVY